MKSLIKFRSNCVKGFGLVLLFGFISLGAIGGCSNNNGAQGGTRALTEKDFASDEALRANPEKDFLVDFLEHPDSEVDENDTGEAGDDVIPLRYANTLEHTFCWEDDDGNAGHFMELHDSEGVEILRLDVNGECATEVIEAGNYVMTIHHDGTTEALRPVFIIPNGGVSELTYNEDNLFNKIDILTSRLFNYFADEAVPEALAANALQTLFTTNKCEGCNLAQANLSQADLKDANLFMSDLSGANLSMANLTGANMNATTLPNANLTGANLSDATLIASVLMKADLSTANLTGTSLLGADLIGANLTGVTLGSTVFDNARWCDGSCTCGAESIDACVGCGSIDICTGS